VDGARDALSGGDVVVVAVVAIELTAQLLGIGGDGGCVLAAVMHLGLCQLQGL
jgi:hypothetical protein